MPCGPKGNRILSSNSSTDLVSHIGFSAVRDVDCGLTWLSFEIGLRFKASRSKDEHVTMNDLHNQHGSPTDCLQPAQGHAHGSVFYGAVTSRSPHRSVKPEGGVTRIPLRWVLYEVLFQFCCSPVLGFWVFFTLCVRVRRRRRSLAKSQWREGGFIQASQTLPKRGRPRNNATEHLPWQPLTAVLCLRSPPRHIHLHDLSARTPAQNCATFSISPHGQLVSTTHSRDTAHEDGIMFLQRSTRSRWSMPCTCIAEAPPILRQHASIQQIA